MSDVGFYHLTRMPLQRALPKLLEKALGSGHRMVLIAGSQERLDALNELLWTYEERSWLPHGGSADGHEAEQPIYLTLDEVNPNGADVLVQVDGVEPKFVGDFARVVDMFDGRDEEAVAAARQRWKAYSAAGHELTYWQQSESGGWEKKT